MLISLRLSSVSKSERWERLPWQCFSLLLCCHVSPPGWHCSAAHFTYLHVTSKNTSENNPHTKSWSSFCETHSSTLLLTSSCVCPRVRRFRQVIGTSLISTSATTRSSLAFVGTGGLPPLITWVRRGNREHVSPHGKYNYVFTLDI